jgi:hypothetical protein
MFVDSGQWALEQAIFLAHAFVLQSLGWDVRKQ